MENDIQLENVHIDAETALAKLNKEALNNVTKGLNSEECTNIVYGVGTQILLDEIERRTKEVNAILKKLTDCIATKYDKDLDVVSKQNLINEVREIVKV